MHNERGEEILDQTPVAMPLHFKRPKPLNERIKEMVAREMSLAAEAGGMETMEEADDFNIPDDPLDPATPYEEDFDPDVKFIGAKYSEMRNGFVKDEIDQRIEKGMKEVERLKALQLKKASKKPKPKPEAREADDSLDDESDDDENK